MLTTGLVAAGFLAVAVFVAVYLRRGTWYRSEMGRHMMAGMAVKLVLFGLILARFVFGDYRWREQVVMSAFALFVGVLWWRVWILLRSPHMRQRGRRDKPEAVVAFAWWQVWLPLGLRLGRRDGSDAGDAG